MTKELRDKVEKLNKMSGKEIEEYNARVEDNRENLFELERELGRRATIEEIIANQRRS